MNIIVCVKQVPDTTEIKIDPVTNTMIRKGVPSILNPFDEFALELALQIKDKTENSTVTLMTMGPEQAKDVLVQGYAMGADDMVLVSDRKFGGADTLSTSYTLAQAIKKLGDYDVIFCGKQAIDGDTAQVGPEIAEHLGIPQITYAVAVDYKDGKIIVKRENDDCYEFMSADLPMLVTVTKAESTPRNQNIRRRMLANRMDSKTITAEDLLGADETRFGLKGSPTRVKKISVPPKKTGGIKLEGYTGEKCADMTIEKLMEEKLI